MVSKKKSNKVTGENVSPECFTAFKEAGVTTKIYVFDHNSFRVSDIDGYGNKQGCLYTGYFKNLVLQIPHPEE